MRIVVLKRRGVAMQMLVVFMVWDVAWRGGKRRKSSCGRPPAGEPAPWHKVTPKTMAMSAHCVRFKVTARILEN